MNTLHSSESTEWLKMQGWRSIRLASMFSLLWSRLALELDTGRWTTDQEPVRWNAPSEAKESLERQAHGSRALESRSLGMAIYLSSYAVGLRWINVVQLCQAKR